VIFGDDAPDKLMFYFTHLLIYLFADLSYFIGVQFLMVTRGSWRVRLWRR